MRAGHNQSLSAAATSLVLLLAGCTVYSPIWKGVSSEAGPITVAGQQVSLVNRCELIDIRLGSGYKCLDYGFKDASGDVVRLSELREELQAAGPLIQHITDSEKNLFSKSRVVYQVYLVAIKPSVYIGVPVLRDEQRQYCGDITCISASWETKERVHGAATLIWRSLPRVREGSFWFVPELRQSSQNLPMSGAELPLGQRGAPLKIAAKNGFWVVEP